MLGASLAAQDLGVKAPPQAQAVVLEGGTIHPVSGPPIARGWLHFEGGVIRGLGEGDAPALPDGAVHIDCTGQHVYPGLIGAVTSLGLIEIGQVAATIDERETGDFTPEVRAAVALNPDSTVIPVTRSNGVLSAGVFPDGNAVPGRVSVISLEGWTSEQMAVEPEAGMVVRWPSSRESRRRDRGRPGSESPREAAEKRRQAIADLFADARSYLAARAADPSIPMDIRFEAMRGALTGEKPVFVRADDVEQIESAVLWAQREKLHVVVVGGAEARLCLDLLRRLDVPVIVTGTHRLPSRRDSDYDEAYALPAQLEQAGIRWCLASGDSFYNERNLPYQAATAVAFGLSREAALRAITLSAAEILGVADRLGSLDPGKHATLFVTNGDPLEIPTHTELAFVQGRRIDLRNKQTELAEKYREKYRQLGLWPESTGESGGK
jgi:imidazolonepropionase-like amidohydrolase